MRKLGAKNEKNELKTAPKFKGSGTFSVEEATLYWRPVSRARRTDMAPKYIAKSIDACTLRTVAETTTDAVAEKSVNQACEPEQGQLRINQYNGYTGCGHIQK